MQGAGSLAGFRYVWHSLRLRYQSVAPSYMREIDPEGTKGKTTEEKDLHF